MEIGKVKQLVEYFEDRIVNNFETHFSYLVLEDFYTGGFEERIQDEFYYDEYFSKYENGIINLLLEIENDMSSEYMDFKIRLIKLKRIIDTRLSNIEIEIQSENKIRPLKQPRKRQFILNSNIDTEKFINVLYNQLYHYKLINVNFEDFKTHFGNDWDNKIQWLGTELQIINFVNQLIKNEYLDIETQNFNQRLISSHFINKKGKGFIDKQLSSVKTEKLEFVPNDDIIFKIMNEISTHF